VLFMMEQAKTAALEQKLEMFYRNAVNVQGDAAIQYFSQKKQAAIDPNRPGNIADLAGNGGYKDGIILGAGLVRKRRAEAAQSRLSVATFNLSLDSHQTLGSSQVTAVQAPTPESYADTKQLANNIARRLAIHVSGAPDPAAIQDTEVTQSMSIPAAETIVSHVAAQESSFQVPLTPDSLMQSDQASNFISRV
jgi:hypothetical protein